MTIFLRIAFMAMAVLCALIMVMSISTGDIITSAFMFVCLFVNAHNFVRTFGEHDLDHWEDS